MHRILRLSFLTLMLVQCGFATSTLAGTIGFPAPRQQPLHLRFELVGESFKEDLNRDIGNAEATTGRALVSVALGLTAWSEVYARAGVAEFNVTEELFQGDFGFAYGGGLRIRLLKFPFGLLGISGQYLRFTSEDPNSVGIRVDATWEEFDVALGLGTRRFGAFQLYTGGLYHKTDITLDPQTGPNSNLDEKTPFRLFFGVNIYPLADFPRGEFLVTVEARFIGETPQFTLGVQYQF